MLRPALLLSSSPTNPRPSAQPSQSQSLARPRSLSSQSRVPYPTLGTALTSWGSGVGGAVGVRSGVEGDLPPLGKNSQDPHTASPAAATFEVAASIPPHLAQLQEKSPYIHVKPTYLLRFFSSPPEAVAMLKPLYFFLGGQQRDALSLSSNAPPAHRPSLMAVLPSFDHKSSESCQLPHIKEHEKFTLAATWRFASRET